VLARADFEANWKHGVVDVAEWWWRCVTGSTNHDRLGQNPANVTGVYDSHRAQSSDRRRGRIMIGAIYARKSAAGRDRREPSIVLHRIAPVRLVGDANALSCADSPRCEHHWFYDFRAMAAVQEHDRHGDKRKAKNIEARSVRGFSMTPRASADSRRSRLIVTDTYLKTHPDVNKASADRAREIIKVLNRSLVSDPARARAIASSSSSASAWRKWRGYKTSAPRRRSSLDCQSGARYAQVIPAQGVEPASCSRAQRAASNA